MDLKNHFLIAMPNMIDSRFKNSVIYMCEHNKDGAMGLIINQAIDLTIASMLEQIDIKHNHLITHPEHLKQSVLFGGPVSEDRGFVLHKNKQNFSTSVSLSEQITITTSKDILGLLGTHNEPEDYVILLGYAGWAAGQLEQEITTNSWLTIEADPCVIFNTPIEQRWEKALKKLGIDALNLSSDIGHA